MGRVLKGIPQMTIKEKSHMNAEPLVHIKAGGPEIPVGLSSINKMNLIT